MNGVVLLFVLGVMLLAGEVFVPGVVLGLLGGLAMAGGCGVAFFQWGALGGVIATLSALVLLGLTLYLELVWLPKSRFGRGLVVQSTQEATSQPVLASPDIVGKIAEAKTPLVPTGYVRVEGRRYEAFCPAGHVAKGVLLRVAGQDNFRLIVNKT